MQLKICSTYKSNYVKLTMNEKKNPCSRIIFILNVAELQGCLLFFNSMFFKKEYRYFVINLHVFDHPLYYTSMKCAQFKIILHVFDGQLSM